MIRQNIYIGLTTTDLYHYLYRSVVVTLTVLIVTTTEKVLLLAITADGMRDLSFTAGEISGSREATVAASYSFGSVVQALHSASPHQVR